MRYREQRLKHQTINGPVGRNNLLFKRLAKRPSRPLRAVEVYQRTRHAKIKAAVLLRGYEALTESEEDPAAATAAVGEPVTVDKNTNKKRVLRAARMSLWQTTVRELFGEEPDDVKAEMEQLTQEENVKRGSGAPPDTDDATSPEALQL
jgi:hypothetical protein